MVTAHSREGDLAVGFRRTRSSKRGHQAPRASGDPDVTENLDNIANDRCAPKVPPDPARAAELAERFRSRSARLEAQRELMRLRERHWSGERIIEESRVPDEWWEHPEADPFAVLGLMPGAPLSEASNARRRVAMECHPDRLPEGADHDMTMRRMVAANAAYDRLRRAMNPAP